MFERKETPNSTPNMTAWTILKWYWLLVPALYFIFIVPTFTEGEGAPALAIEDLYNFAFHLFNLSLAGILTQTHPLERSRTGAADGILKMAIVQQIFIRNVFGIALTIFAWYKLPHKIKPEMLSTEEAEANHFQPKTLYILTGLVLFLTTLVIISQFVLL